MSAIGYIARGHAIEVSRHCELRGFFMGGEGRVWQCGSCPSPLRVSACAGFASNVDSRVGGRHRVHLRTSAVVDNHVDSILSD